MFDRLPLVRIGMRRVLEEASPPPTVTMVADPDELVLVCATDQPDVVLFELLFAGEEEVGDIVEQCRAVSPRSRFLALHLGRRTDHLQRAEQLGVALVSYASESRMVRAAVEGVSAGAPMHRDRRRAAGRTLSAAERAVLRLLAEGCSCSTAADRLDLSVTEVRRITADVLDCLGAETLREAVSRARQVGLVARLQQAS